MEHLLSNEKLAWLDQFKPSVNLKGLPLHHNEVSAARFAKELRILVNKMAKEAEIEIRKLFERPATKEFFSGDESVASQAKRTSEILQKKFDNLFSKHSRVLTNKVLTDASHASAHSIALSMKKLTSQQGLALRTDFLTAELSEVLKAGSEVLHSEIKSIPQQYHARIQSALLRSITEGRGLADLLPEIRKIKGITERRARMIAYDQTRKMYAAINLGRLKKLGVRRGEWLHSGGSNEPRKTHERMSGKIFDLDKGMWDSSVKKYIQAGQLPNCGCTIIPVIEFDDGKPKR